MTIKYHKLQNVKRYINNEPNDIFNNDVQIMNKIEKKTHKEINNIII